MAQSGLELLVLLHLPPESWDFIQKPPCLLGVYVLFQKVDSADDKQPHPSPVIHGYCLCWFASCCWDKTLTKDYLGRKRFTLPSTAYHGARAGTQDRNLQAGTDAKTMAEEHCWLALKDLFSLLSFFIIYFD